MPCGPLGRKSRRNWSPLETELMQASVRSEIFRTLQREDKLQVKIYSVLWVDKWKQYVLFHKVPVYSLFHDTECFSEKPEWDQWEYEECQTMIQEPYECLAQPHYPGIHFILPAKVFVRGLHKSIGIPNFQSVAPKGNLLCKKIKLEIEHLVQTADFLFSGKSETHNSQSETDNVLFMLL